MLDEPSTSGGIAFPEAEKCTLGFVVRPHKSGFNRFTSDKETIFPRSFWAIYLLARPPTSGVTALSRPNQEAGIVHFWLSDWCIRLDCLGSNFQRY